jgi:hypothetical protein
MQVLAVLRDDAPAELGLAPGDPHAADLLRDLLYKIKRAYAGLAPEAMPPPARKAVDMIGRYFPRGGAAKSGGGGLERSRGSQHRTPVALSAEKGAHPERRAGSRRSRSSGCRTARIVPVCAERAARLPLRL